jgi:chorismate lyase/3-hydroxybenzoate synthase
MDRLLAKPAVRAPVDALQPPAWAAEMPADHFILLTERVADAAQLPADEFECRTFQAYGTLADRLAQSPMRHPVRFWNHVPFITDPAEGGRDNYRDNYMVFNAGRFRAFADWLGGTARFERDVATASAIGHWGPDLVIHCLATDSPGVAVNNPRQVAPYHYSQRFGPLPPCFARATQLVTPRGMLLVGGTASVRGEDSVHQDDLASQLAETFLNLSALIGAAARRQRMSTAQLLGAFRELRVYYPDRARAKQIESAVFGAFPALRRLETLHADLCRAELLVEIEGFADLRALTS